MIVVRMKEPSSGPCTEPIGAKKAGATDDRGGDRLQFPSFRLGRVTDADSRGEQNADEGSAERRENVGDVEHPSRVDARKPGRFHVGANREEVATEPALMQKNIGGNRHHHDHPEKIRHAEKVAAREAGECIVGNGDGGAIGDQQTNAAQRRQRGQRHDERRQTEAADSKGVENANERRRTRSVMRIDAQIGKSCVSNQAMMTLAKPTTAPTDRSIPAVIMTKVSPMARIAVIAPCRSRLAMLLGVQKLVVLNDKHHPHEREEAQQGQAKQRADTRPFFRRGG